MVAGRVEEALAWMRPIAEEIGGWEEPAFEEDAGGNFHAEWWNGYRKVAAYLIPGAVDCFRVLTTPEGGVEIREYGDVSEERWRGLWAWLREG